MTALLYLVPISLLLGGVALYAFFWTVRSDQYDDAEGNANRILTDRYDDEPKSDDE
jgi:cbb3-type cytochrome oxidase maturation protein